MADEDEDAIGLKIEAIAGLVSFLPLDEMTFDVEALGFVWASDSGSDFGGGCDFLAGGEKIEANGWFDLVFLAAGGDDSKYRL